MTHNTEYPHPKSKPDTALKNWEIVRWAETGQMPDNLNHCLSDVKALLDKGSLGSMLETIFPDKAPLFSATTGRIQTEKPNEAAAPKQYQDLTCVNCELYSAEFGGWCAACDALTVGDFEDDSLHLFQDTTPEFAMKALKRVFSLKKALNEK